MICYRAQILRGISATSIKCDAVLINAVTLLDSRVNERTDVDRTNNLERKIFGQQTNNNQAKHICTEN